MPTRLWLWGDFFLFGSDRIQCVVLLRSCLISIVFFYLLSSWLWWRWMLILVNLVEWCSARFVLLLVNIWFVSL